MISVVTATRRRTAGRTVGLIFPPWMATWMRMWVPGSWASRHPRLGHAWLGLVDVEQGDGHLVVGRGRHVVVAGERHPLTSGDRRHRIGPRAGTDPHARQVPLAVVADVERGLAIAGDRVADHLAGGGVLHRDVDATVVDGAAGAGEAA